VPRKYEPTEVLPPEVSRLLGRDPYWFVIGGHAVRCFCPYRPSHDVDFGVERPRDLEALLRIFRTKGKVRLLERGKDTAHLSLDGIDVSIFVLPSLVVHTDGHSLTAIGILATKLHAVLDRGTRRDFFDLYVMMNQESLGVIDCIRAMREVYATDVNEGLLLRAIAYFEDARAEAPLPGEGPDDWSTVTTFFTRAAGALITPPGRALDIESRLVDVRSRKKSGKSRPRTRR
jgi:hypothetical protein